MIQNWFTIVTKEAREYGETIQTAPFATTLQVDLYIKKMVN